MNAVSRCGQHYALNPAFLILVASSIEQVKSSIVEERAPAEKVGIVRSPRISGQQSRHQFAPSQRVGADKMRDGTGISLVTGISWVSCTLQKSMDILSVMAEPRVIGACEHGRLQQQLGIHAFNFLMLCFTPDASNINFYTFSQVLHDFKFLFLHPPINIM
jgi:hypothetical protein